MGRVRSGPEVPVDVPPRADAAGLHDHRRRGTAGTSSRRRSTPWRRAGCTTTSAEASPATRSIANGSCRTSRRCCTTRRCSCGPTCTASSSSAGRPGARSSARRSRTSSGQLRHPDGGFYSAEDADSPDADGHGVEGLFHTWTPAEARCGDGRISPTTSQTAALDWFGITDEGNFEGRSIPNRLHARGELERPPHIEAARQGPVRRPRTASASRARRQGAHRVERAVPVGTGRGRRRLRSTGLARRRGRQRRVPVARTAAAQRALVAELAGRRRATGPPRRARRRPRRARRRLHTARGGHRAGPLDPRGGGGGRHDARVVLGSGERRPLHDRRGRRGADRAAEGSGRQRDAVGELHGRDRAVPPRRPHR